MQKWLRAKLESPCALCGTMIQKGDRILPWGQASEHQFRYMHMSCARQTNYPQEVSTEEAPVCKHWKARGFCLYGETCVFSHPPEMAAAAEQQAAVRAAHSAPGTDAATRARPNIRCKTGKGRNKIRNRFRAGTFRRFLIDTFGREQLRAGAGVLDVAGGKGELAFELLNLNGVPATVVEPRPLDLERRIKWLQSGFYHWNRLFSRYNDRRWISSSAEQSAAGAGGAVDSAGVTEAPSGPVAGSLALPKHLRLVITREICGLLGLSAEEGESGTEEGESGRLLASIEGIQAAGGGSCFAKQGLLLPAPAPAPAMPPGWPAAFQRAQQEARHSRWTRRGLEHESRAAAVAAAGGGGDASEEESDGTSSEGAADAAPEAAACLFTVPAGGAFSGSGGISAPAAQLPAVGRGAVLAQRPTQAPNAPADGAAAVAAAAAAPPPLLGPSQPGLPRAVGPSGCDEGNGPGGVGQFLEELFARMNGAASPDGASSLRPSLPPSAAAAGAPAVSGGSSPVQPGPGQEQGELESGAGGSNQTAGHFASVGQFLDGLFARMDLAAPALAGAGQHQQQQPQQHPQWPPQRQPQQQLAAEEAAGGRAAGSVGGITAPRGPPAVGEQAGQALGEEEGEADGSSDQSSMPLPADVGQFLDGLCARMELGGPVPATGQQQQRGRQEAGPAASAATPPTTGEPVVRAEAAVLQQAGQGRGAEREGEREGEEEGAVGGSSQTAEHFASVGQFLERLYARMDGGTPNAASARQPPPAAAAAGDAAELTRAEGEGGAAGAAASMSAAAAGVAGMAGAAGQGEEGGGEGANFLTELFSSIEAAALPPASSTAPAEAASGGRDWGMAAGAMAEPIEEATASLDAAAAAASSSAVGTWVGGQQVEEVEDPQQAWQLLTNCSIVVGMHSDQATEFVVDLALRYNRPFAVVPCCVYACEFPGRRLRGRPVRKYEQFIEYLVSKAPRRIRVAQLPFEGKNKVVYCL